MIDDSSRGISCRKGANTIFHLCELKSHSGETMEEEEGDDDDDDDEVAAFVVIY